MSAIHIVGPALGGGSDLDGHWLKSYDPDAFDGRGHIVGTKDRAEAKEFPSAGAALAFWKQASTVRPFREDGRPNRPLTAYTVEIAP